jgi:hypothetical protein
MESGWLEDKRAFEVPVSPLHSPDVSPDISVEKPPHVGEPCPRCKVGRLDYDGLLNLSCPHCGYSLGGGGFT